MDTASVSFPSPLDSPKIKFSAHSSSLHAKEQAFNDHDPHKQQLLGQKKKDGKTSKFSPKPRLNTAMPLIHEDTNRPKKQIMMKRSKSADEFVKRPQKNRAFLSPSPQDRLADANQRGSDASSSALPSSTSPSNDPRNSIPGLNEADLKSNSVEPPSGPPARIRKIVSAGYNKIHGAARGSKPKNAGFVYSKSASIRSGSAHANVHDAELHSKIQNQDQIQSFSYASPTPGGTATSTGFSSQQQQTSPLSHLGSHNYSYGFGYGMQHPQQPQVQILIQVDPNQGTPAKIGAPVSSTTSATLAPEQQQQYELLQQQQLFLYQQQLLQQQQEQYAALQQQQMFKNFAGNPSTLGLARSGVPPSKLLEQLSFPSFQTDYKVLQSVERDPVLIHVGKMIEKNLMKHIPAKSFQKNMFEKKIELPHLKVSLIVDELPKKYDFFHNSLQSPQKRHDLKMKQMKKQKKNKTSTKNSPKKERHDNENKETENKEIKIENETEKDEKEPSKPEESQEMEPNSPDYHPYYNSSLEISSPGSRLSASSPVDEQQLKSAQQFSKMIHQIDEPYLTFLHSKNSALL